MKKKDAPIDRKSAGPDADACPSVEVPSVMVPGPHESLDTLFDGKIKILQSRSGYRFSLDAVLLAHFVNPRPGNKVIDLGTGNGVIPLMLAHLHPSISIAGVELQHSMAARAASNVRFNGLESRIDILQGDVRAIGKIALPQSFAVVVCNPPFRQPTSGRLSVDGERRIARHEMKGGLNDFIHAGAFLLGGGGRLAMIYPAVRCIDLLAAMRRARIEPKRLRMVHSFAGAEAALVLVEGNKGGRPGLEVLAPLIVYREAKDYSGEIAMMLAGRRH
jgi:tRNA1Val (adenine37-N6)-methyltransferase